MAYRILIADDQKMVRQMFETAVNSSPDYEIAGMAQTAEEAVRSCLEQKIDLVLMDVVLGLGKDGLDAAKQIKQERPEVKILLVTPLCRKAPTSAGQRRSAWRASGTRKCRSSRFSKY